MKKIVIVGFGSIGQRHFNNFKGLNCDVRVVSRRNLESSIFSYPDLKSCLTDFNPDVIFVCNETNLHRPTLIEIKNCRFENLVVVEKPFAESLGPAEDFFKKVKVAYNFRFNPLLIKLKEDLQAKKITSAICYVGQYLPSWRPAQDYRNSYSSKKEAGGGVLLDLSHELDFCRWLFGKGMGLFAAGGKLSNLEISSDDTVSILANFEKASNVTINLNYTDRITNRFVIVNTDTDSIRIDFIKKTYEINGKKTDFQFDYNEPYIQMAENIIYNNASRLTSFDEAFDIMKFVEAAHSSIEGKKWIEI